MLDDNMGYDFRLNTISISINEIQVSNGINSQLSITRSDRQDSGVYKCIAENPFGKSEHIIYLAVQGMWTFWLQQKKERKEF